MKFCADFVLCLFFSLGIKHFIISFFFLFAQLFDLQIGYSIMETSLPSALMSSVESHLRFSYRNCVTVFYNIVIVIAGTERFFLLLSYLLKLKVLSRLVCACQHGQPFSGN